MYSLSSRASNVTVSMPVRSEVITPKLKTDGKQKTIY